MVPVTPPPPNHEDSLYPAVRGACPVKTCPVKTCPVKSAAALERPARLRAVSGVRHDRMVMNFPDSGNFVGRASELAALVDALADQRVRAVLVSGEAGIGKSRLVAEFASRAGAGALVLVGHCPELGEGGVPFAPFIA